MALNKEQQLPINIKTLTKDQIELLSVEQIKALTSEQITAVNEKIKILDNQIEKETIKLSNYIDKITDATSEITILLEEKVFLENQKVNKFKNFVIIFFSFGCYNKNKIIEKKLKINNNKVQTKIKEQADLQNEFKNTKLARKKISDELGHLMNISKWLKNSSESKELPVQEVNAMKLNGQPLLNHCQPNLSKI